MTFNALLTRLNDLEGPFCRAASLRGEARDTQLFFAIISRLGDGVFWYLLMAVLPVLYGSRGLVTATHMLVVGGVALLIYKPLKQQTVRRRPCHEFDDVRRHAPMLDLYSFPSGHTMHAVGFSVVLLVQVPEVGLLVLPFASLVAVSRVVLGLHYPSDVLAGALTGGSVAWCSLHLFA